MKGQEHEVQKAICDYLDLRRICYWAVPNGGKRNKIEAKRLRDEGTKAGVPDLTIVYRGKYFGLEVKKPLSLTPKGRLSKNQKNMIEKIEVVGGGAVAIVHSVEDVILTFAEWKIGE